MMEKKLQKLFDSLEPEELSPLPSGSFSYSLARSEENRVTADILYRLGFSGYAKGKKRNVAKIVLIAAILTVLLMISAVAYYLSGGRFFQSLLPKESYQIAESFIFSDLCAAQNESCRFTVESAMRDGHYTTVILSLEALDGNSLEGVYPDLDVTVSPAGRLRPGMSLEALQTEENMAKKRYYILVVKSTESFEQVELHLKGLRTGSDTESWTESLSISAEITSAPILKGEYAEIKAELSPFGLWIDLPEKWEGTGLISASLPVHDLFLIYRDGTEKGASAKEFADPERMETVGWGATEMPNGSGRAYISIRFTFFEDLSQIEALRLDNLRIPFRGEQ